VYQTAASVVQLRITGSLQRGITAQEKVDQTKRKKAITPFVINLTAV
jgi:hypothetical protein